MNCSDEDDGPLDIRPRYDIQWNPRESDWFGGVVVNFALRREAPADLHLEMLRATSESLDGRSPHYIYGEGAVYLMFRLLSLTEKGLVGAYADRMVGWLDRPVEHRVFLFGADRAEAARRRGEERGLEL